jgi:hypothetical protein
MRILKMLVRCADWLLLAQILWAGKVTQKICSFFSAYCRRFAFIVWAKLTMM